MKAKDVEAGMMVRIVFARERHEERFVGQVFVVDEVRDSGVIAAPSENLGRNTYWLFSELESVDEGIAALYGVDQP